MPNEETRANMGKEFLKIGLSGWILGLFAVIIAGIFLFIQLLVWKKHGDDFMLEVINIFATMLVWLFAIAVMIWSRHKVKATRTGSMMQTEQLNKEIEKRDNEIAKLHGDSRMSSEDNKTLLLKLDGMETKLVHSGAEIREKDAEIKRLMTEVAPPVPLGEHPIAVPKARTLEQWTKEGGNLTRVTNRKFEYVEEILDGKEYVNCTFTHVSLFYDGTAPSGLSNSVLDPDTSSHLHTHSPGIAQWVEIARAIGLFRPDLKHTVNPLPEVPIPEALPTSRPKIVPVGFGPSSPNDSLSGLFIENEGESAYDISIPDVSLGKSTVKIKGSLARLTKQEGKKFCGIWIERPQEATVGGGCLFDEMRKRDLEEIIFSIHYRDTDTPGHRYITKCKFERDVTVKGGIVVRFVRQELATVAKTSSDQC